MSSPTQTLVIRWYMWAYCSVTVLSSGVTLMGLPVQGRHIYTLRNSVSALVGSLPGANLDSCLLGQGGSHLLSMLHPLSQHQSTLNVSWQVSIYVYFIVVNLRLCKGQTVGDISSLYILQVCVYILILLTLSSLDPLWNFLSSQYCGWKLVIRWPWIPSKWHHGNM